MMRSNTESSDFIVLTDFENDGIFVLPSNRHTQIQPPRIPSAPAVVLEENPTLQQSQSNLIKVPQIEFTRYLAQLWEQSGDWLRRKWVALYSWFENSFDWSILQAWNATGYMTCTVPYRLVLSHEGKYQIKSNKMQKVFWYYHAALNLISLTGGIRELAVHLKGDPNPFQYISGANLIVSTGARICFLKTVAKESNKLFRIHELARTNNALSSFHSRKVGAASFVAFFMCTMVIVVLNCTSFTHSLFNHWGFRIEESIQAFACYSREIFTWQEVDGCAEYIFNSLVDIPVSEFLLGLLGIAMYVNKILAEQSMILLLLACSLTLLVSVYHQRVANIANNQHLSNYNFLKEMSLILSEFEGFLLTTQLVNIACTLPGWLDMMFVTRNALFFKAGVIILINLASFLTACVSALIIDEMEDEFATPERSNELPEDARALAGFFYKLFRKSIGIGYRGLFVLNFRFFFSYIGIIGTFITVLFETKKAK